MALVRRLFPLLLISSGLAFNLVSSHRPISTFSLVVPYSGDSGVPLTRSSLQHRFTVTSLRSLTSQHADSTLLRDGSMPILRFFPPPGPILLLKIDVTSSCNRCSVTVSYLRTVACMRPLSRKSCTSRPWCPFDTHPWDMGHAQTQTQTEAWAALRSFLIEP